MRTIKTFADLVSLVNDFQAQGQQVYVRYCRGPARDAKSEYRSFNHQTGEHLDGLSCNLLSVPDYWPINGRTGDTWVAMQVADYSYMRYQGGRGTAAYIIVGTETDGRGSDNEVLVTKPTYIGKLADGVVEDAIRLNK